MGCMICNIIVKQVLHGFKMDNFEWKDMDDWTEEEKQYGEEIKQEICNDIATRHPEMVREINRLREEVDSDSDELEKADYQSDPVNQQGANPDLLNQR